MRQDELEVRAQGHTDQTVNRRDRADTGEIKTVRLAHALRQLVADPIELRHDISRPMR